MLVGLLQMAGDLTGLTALRGIGAASGASPAPRVFSELRGLETYSTRFFVEWNAPDGTHGAELTPQRYGMLRGPYIRRNVYGAALAYGPVLDSDPRWRPLYRAVAGSALCGTAPVLRELGLEVPRDADGLRVRYEPIAGTRMGDLPRVLGAPCG